MRQRGQFFTIIKVLEISITLGKLLAGLIDGFELKIGDEFANAFETMMQELGIAEKDQIIKQDGKIILRKKNLKLDSTENLWKEKAYRMIQA